MRKALFLFTRPPYPATDGTKIKILSNILDAARGGFDCEIVVVTDVRPDKKAIVYLEEHYGRVYYHYASRWRRGLAALWYWLFGYPLQVGFFYSRDTARHLAESFASAGVIYAHTLRFGKYLEKLSPRDQKKVLLDFNDAISWNYDTARRYALGIWKIIYGIEARRLAAYEQKMLFYPFTFSIVSAADRDHLRSDKIVVIEHGVQDGLLMRDNRHNGPLNIIFMGNMLYPPNLDAVTWLARLFAHHRFEGVEGNLFDAVGRCPKGLAKKLPTASFLGFVDDAYAVVINHKVFVAPLRFGAGVQTKMLDAMALGMPVVTSPTGAQGLDGAVHGEHLFIVDMEDEESWRHTIQTLLLDAALRARIGEQARAFIRARYTASRARGQFNLLFKSIIIQPT